MERSLKATTNKSLNHFRASDCLHFEEKGVASDREKIVM